METEKRKFFYSSYSAIENEIINGADKFKHQADKAESAKKLFHQQIEGVPSEWILEYIEYIKTQEIRDVWKRDGLSQLKRYLPSIESKIILFRPITPPPKVTPPLYFTRLFTPDQLKLLYNGLTTGGFLPLDTDPEAFNYVFGVSDKPKDFNGLGWLKGKQYLRELLTPIKHPDIILAELEKLVILYFIDRKGKVIKLAKNKEYPIRPDSKAIVRILKEATM